MAIELRTVGKETGYRSRRSDIICFKFGMQGHKQFWCPNSDGIPHNCDESQGDGKVKLACGYGRNI